jgi:light-regulated signal transduction histidine kinase (bacteriophytochrome)
MLMKKINKNPGKSKTTVKKSSVKTSKSHPQKSATEKKISKNTASRIPESAIEEIQELKNRLSEAEKTLEAIRSGAVDAVVYPDLAGQKLSENEFEKGPDRLELSVTESATEGQASEAELLARNEELARTAELQAANKELEAFSYSVSHDLRVPLRHMSGFVKFLQQRLKDHPDQKTRYYADAISEASTKMSMLIDDLLNFSRIARKEMRKKKVNLNALVKEVLHEMREELKERNIKWEIDELPDAVGDESLLRLVIVNLVSNSVKFTSTRAQAEIRIGCKDEVDKLIYFITDNGVGFDMKYADKLFGVFQRLHTQNEFEGTGIGLANVQRIISRHGGRVWAEGIEGQGATFYFCLPKYPHLAKDKT